MPILRKKFTYRDIALTGRHRLRCCSTRGPLVGDRTIRCFRPDSSCANLFFLPSRRPIQSHPRGRRSRLWSDCFLSRRIHLCPTHVSSLKASWRKPPRLNRGGCFQRRPEPTVVSAGPTEIDKFCGCCGLYRQSTLSPRCFPVDNR